MESEFLRTVIACIKDSVLCCITPNPCYYYEGDFPEDLGVLIDGWPICTPAAAAAAAAADTAWSRLDGIMNEMIWVHILALLHMNFLR